MFRNNKYFLPNVCCLLVAGILFFHTPAFAQYTITTLSCDSTYSHCDTLSIEDFNVYKKPEKKIKSGNLQSSVSYIYNTKGVLLKKIHRDQQGEIQKINTVYSDSSGFWHTDSLTDKSGKVLFVFKRTRTNVPYRYQVEWFYKSDTIPSSRQLIQYDSLDNELSNSTCYSADNCITYRFFYAGKRKIKSELWVLEGRANTPVLKETEEYIYKEGEDELASGSLRFSEPDHRCIARFRYLIEKRSLNR